jgi:hypothetical protein
VTQGYWQPNPNDLKSFSFFAEHGPEPALQYSGDSRPNRDVAFERRFLFYAKEKHNAVNTSPKRIGCSRKDDRKSSRQARVCSQLRNSSHCCTSGAEDSLATIGKKDRDSRKCDDAIEAGEQSSCEKARTFGQ